MDTDQLYESKGQQLLCTVSKGNNSSLLLARATTPLCCEQGQQLLCVVSKGNNSSVL